MHSSKYKSPVSLVTAPQSFHGSKFYCWNRGREGQDVSLGGEEELGLFSLMHTTRALGGFFWCPRCTSLKIMNTVLVSFVELVITAEMELKKAAIKRQATRNLRKHTTSQSPQEEFQSQNFCTSLTLQQSILGLPTLKYMIFLLGPPAVNLQMFRV